MGAVTLGTRTENMATFLIFKSLNYKNMFSNLWLYAPVMMLLELWAHTGWWRYIPISITRDDPIQRWAIFVSSSYILPEALSCHPSFAASSLPHLQPALAFQWQWLLCCGAVVFVCALLAMAACSPPGSPVCQRWLQQNRLWEQPVSLLWSPAPQPEGQPSIQRSPCPFTHTEAQTHKCPTKHTLTQKAYKAHTLSQ